MYFLDVLFSTAKSYRGAHSSITLFSDFCSSDTFNPFNNNNVKVDLELNINLNFFNDYNTSS